MIFLFFALDVSRPYKVYSVIKIRSIKKGKICQDKLSLISDVFGYYQGEMT